MEPGLLIGLGAAAFGALATWLATVRRLSGSVAKSEATDLWAESKSIREYQAEMARETQAVVTHLRAEIRRCTERNAELDGIIVELRLKIGRLERELEDFK